MKPSMITNEDITPLDVPADPPTIMQGLMTQAQMRQLMNGDPDLPLGGGNYRCGGE